MLQQENYNALIRGLKSILSDPKKAGSIRPSQQKVLADFIQSAEQFKTGIFDLATAFGKTRIMALMADAYRQNASKPIVIAEPTRELVGQVAAEMADYFGDATRIGKFFSEKKDTQHPILVTTYSSLEKLTQTINPENVGLLLLDEGHHAVSDKRMEIVRRFSNACQYGMTATPDYSEDRTLRNLLTHTIAHVDIIQAIQDEILSPFSNTVLLSNFQMDLSQVKRCGGIGDYNITEYRQAFAKALSPVHLSNTEEDTWQTAHRKIAHEVAVFYQNLAPYKKHCLINCHTQEEARIQAEEINAVFGKPVAGVWTTDTQNTQALDDFEAGKLGVLCQVGMLQEGYDFPALDLCINYPTASRVRALQRGGRTLRLDPNNPQKHADIVDIIFRFPGSHNPYTSARKNNQILYSDVVRAISVAPRSPHRNGQGVPFSLPKLPPINLQHFKVVSDIKTLLTFKRKDQQKKATEFLPMKQPGMLSANDLADTFGGTPSVYAKLLQEIYDSPSLNIRMDAQNVPFELVHRVRSSNSETLCLSNHAMAINIFQEICKEKYPGRNVNKVSIEEYTKGFYLPKEELHEIFSFLHPFKFKTADENGVEHFLISKKPSHPPSFLLYDHEDTRQDLYALITLTDLLKRIPEMPNDMYDLATFETAFAINHDTIAPFIKRAILKEKTYTDQNGRQKPLVQFYTAKDEYYGDSYYGICVPNNIKGQTELLRFCGFHIYKCTAHDVFEYNIDSIYHANMFETRWKVFKKAKRENLTLRKVGSLLNLTPEAVRQYFNNIKYNLRNALCKASLKSESTDSNERYCEDPNKNALYVSDPDSDFLITYTAIWNDEREFARKTRDKLSHLSASQIIRIDQAIRLSRTRSDG